ncbi:MAG: FecR domain-containing protein [Saprospiraceae bacterium]|nr:FecR domain-containing protein [Saprospiraceae bacterium]
MNLRDNINKLNESDGRKQADLIQLWKDEAAANLQSMKSELEGQIPVDQLKGYQQYSSATAFEKITSEPYHKVVPMWRKWAVAALFTGLLAVSGLYLYQKSSANTTLVAEATIYSSRLNDGSEVTLDKNTRMDYNGDRGVSIAGRAFFKVAKKENGALFTVDLNKGKVTVLGTRFSVTSLPGETEVAVEEGRVRYEYEGRSILLKAGERMKLSGEDIVSSPILSNNQFSWSAQVLEFKNTPLDRAIQDIGRHFHQNLSLAAEIKSAGKCLLTTRFTSENIDQVLEELKLLFQIQYHKSGDRYVITSMKC